jgi:uncharacterized protein
VAPPFATPAQIKASKHVDWTRALPACQAAVEANPSDPHLQYLLGTSYDGVKNYIEAARHYTIAANAGHADAECALGYLVVTGKGALKDSQRAFDLFNKAAMGGSPCGMGNLGSMYSNGFFVKEDDAKALEWYGKSIEAGSSFALGQLAVMYYAGKGTPVDYNTAAQYFQQGADMDEGYSLKALAFMYEHGLLGNPDPAKASELRLRAAQVDPDSQDPVLNLPQRQAAPRPRVSHVHYVRIYRYRFLGCSWVWC